MHERTAAAAAGRPRDAIDRLDEAVALGRGVPLPGLVDHRFAQESSARFEALLLDAQEARIDAELATGRHADVVEDLAALVAEHPVRERFHAQRITALYRCGRQADALRAYQQAREVLAEELGLGPGVELQALERAVLTQDPALASPVPLAPAAPAIALPVPLTSFVGRAAERRAHRRRHRSGAPRDAGRPGRRGQDPSRPRGGATALAGPGDLVRRAGTGDDGHRRPSGDRGDGRCP